MKQKNRCKGCESDRLVLEGTIKDPASKYDGKNLYRCEMCGKTQAK